MAERKKSSLAEVIGAIGSVKSAHDLGKIREIMEADEKRRKREELRIMGIEGDARHAAFMAKAEKFDKESQKFFEENKGLFDSESAAAFSQNEATENGEDVTEKATNESMQVSCKVDSGTVEDCESHLQETKGTVEKSDLEQSDKKIRAEICWEMYEKKVVICSIFAVTALNLLFIWMTGKFDILIFAGFYFIFLAPFYAIPSMILSRWNRTRVERLSLERKKVRDTGLIDSSSQQCSGRGV